MKRYDLAVKISSRFTPAEQRLYDLSFSRVNKMMHDLEFGLADIIREHGFVRITDFGRFSQYKYLAPERYVNRERVRIVFKRLPWYHFNKAKEEETE